MKETFFISIIIPCRNEEGFIGKCLETVLEQDYPKENMEVLVIDGMSEDKTRETIEKSKIKNQKLNIRLLDNPKKFTPFALNIGIKEAKGDIIIRMDAHAGYEKDYVSRCVKYSKEYSADNVGGIMKTLPRGNTIASKAIALVLSHPFGVGGSTFRKGSKKVVETDTVFGGCYKREVFGKIGFFNENLVRSQDMEFNIRLKKAGGKIILAPDIVCYYYPKDNLRDFLKHNFQDGVWAILPLKFVKFPLKMRHYIPLIFSLTLPLSIWPYLLFSLFFSVQLAVREKSLYLFFMLPLAFGARHLGYGFGSVWGIIRLISGK